MKMLYTTLILLSLAGVGYMQGAGQDCTNSCDDDLVCMEDICRVKIGASCSPGSATECPPSAGLCLPTINPKCECQIGKVPTFKNTVCGVKVDESCAGSKVCVDTADCTSDKCVCKAGLTALADKTKCEKSASGVVGGSLMLVLAALLIPCWM